MSKPKRQRSEQMPLNARQLALAVVTEFMGGEPLKEHDMPQHLRGFFSREFEEPPEPNTQQGTWPDRIRNARDVDFNDNDKAVITTHDNETWEIPSKNHKGTLTKMLTVRPGLCGDACKDEGEVGVLIARWKNILEL